MEDIDDYISVEGKTRFREAFIARTSAKLNSTPIPFGKYKDEGLLRICLDDPKYLQWCVEQDWLQERYADIYEHLKAMYSQ